MKPHKCRIKWSQHAVDRMDERFGNRDDIVIPNEKIAEQADGLPVDSHFKIQACGVVFVCATIPGGVKVITVAYTPRKFKKKHKKQLRAWSSR